MSGPAATGAEPAPRKLTRVAVGVLVRPDGALLVADRPEGKPYPGYWEFPGGKIEPGESVHAALARELHEELGIRVARSWPWTTLEHQYPHAHVRLHFRRIVEFDGEPVPREGQRLRWLLPGEDPPQPLLPAAVPALRWARVPTCVGLMPSPFPEHLPSRLEVAIERGLRVLIAPAPTNGDQDREWEQALAIARSRSVSLLLHRPAPRVPDCDGVLLAQAELACTRIRPAGGLVGARIDDAAALAQAARLGLDFAIIPSHLSRVLALPGLAPLPLLVQPHPEVAVAALRDTWSAGGHGLLLGW